MFDYSYYDQSSGLAAVYAAIDGGQLSLSAGARAPASSPPRSVPPPAAPPAPAAVTTTPKVVTESERHAIIDRATLPGCEALAARLKADPSVSWGDCALQLLAEWDRVQGTVRPASAAADHQVAPSAPTNLAAIGEHARQEWRASGTLQAEFSTADRYAAFKVAEASGRVRIIASGAAGRPAGRSGSDAVNLVEIGDRARQEWQASAELRRDFATADRYATYAQAVAQGRVKVYGAGAVRRFTNPNA